MRTEDFLDTRYFYVVKRKKLWNLYDFRGMSFKQHRINGGPKKLVSSAENLTKVGDKRLFGDLYLYPFDFKGLSNHYCTTRGTS